MGAGGDSPDALGQTIQHSLDPYSSRHPSVCVTDGIMAGQTRGFRSRALEGQTKQRGEKTADMQGVS